MGEREGEARRQGGGKAKEPTQRKTLRQAKPRRCQEEAKKKEANEEKGEGRCQDSSSSTLMPRCQDVVDILWYVTVIVTDSKHILKIYI
jgi:hypothetical protein